MAETGAPAQHITFRKELRRNLFVGRIPVERVGGAHMSLGFVDPTLDWLRRNEIGRERRIGRRLWGCSDFVGRASFLFFFCFSITWAAPWLYFFNLVSLYNVIYYYTGPYFIDMLINGPFFIRRNFIWWNDVTDSFRSLFCCPWRNLSFLFVLNLISSNCSTMEKGTWLLSLSCCCLVY